MTGSIEQLAANVKRVAKRNPMNAAIQCIKHIVRGSEYFPIHSHVSAGGQTFEINRDDKVLIISNTAGDDVVVHILAMPDGRESRYRHEMADEWDLMIQFNGIGVDGLDSSRISAMAKFLYDAAELSCYDIYGQP